MWFLLLVGVAGHEKIQSMSSCSAPIMHAIDENYLKPQEQTGIEKFRRPGKGPRSGLAAMGLWGEGTSGANFFYFFWPLGEKETERRAESGETSSRRKERGEVPDQEVRVTGNKRKEIFDPEGNIYIYIYIYIPEDQAPL